MSATFRFDARIFGLRSLPFLVLATLLTLVGTRADGQEKKLKDLQWSHAFDLACRKLDEKDITEKTRRWGVEAFRDKNTLDGIGLYVSETGTMCLAPNFKTLPIPFKSEGPKWFTGLDFPTRKAGVTKFEKTTKVHSMEAFRDPNTNNWMYITEQGHIAATDGKPFAGAANKNPEWLHSVDLQVRKGGVKEFKDAAKFGIEVYRDGNTQNLVYITENGYVALIHEAKKVVVEKDKPGKSPDWLHGLDLSCRKSNEPAFTKDTRKFGVEVYHDVTTGNLIFISETGSIAVTPAPGDVKAPTMKAKEPTWTHGLNVRARKYGEKEFSETTKAYGAEVFLDENIGMYIYVNENGQITAISAK